MLQEAHCTDKSAQLSRAEWGYEAIFSCWSSNKAGTVILFNNTFSLKLQKFISDPEGRFIFCDIKIEEKCLTLANIYAPNSDDPFFLIPDLIIFWTFSANMLL